MKKMPKLENGMFGIEADGDKFVVVNDHLVYQSGLYEDVSYFDENGYGEYEGQIAKLVIGCKCFNDLEDGTGTVIFEI